MATALSTSAPSLRDLADGTPATRERYVDLLRALSIAVVVFGHWLMAAVYLRDGRIEGENALDAIPFLWLATWVLQVMPIFFFVGGFSNLLTWKSRGRDASAFLGSRMERLLRPTLVFVGIWLCVVVVLGAIDANWLIQATPHLAKPVWFLAVYVLTISLAPVMIRLHEAHRARVLIVLTASAIVVDIVRLAFDMEVVGYLNFAFVWLFAHQLGFFYADGSLTKLSARTHAAIASVGLGAVALLSLVGPYAPSMVGTVTEKASNNSPPSICLIALTCWLVGVAMWVRPVAVRWLQKSTVWTAVVAANSMIMTVFLWHLTALLIAVVMVLPLGFPQPAVGTLEWWFLRPLWIGILITALVPFVMLFGRFERSGLTASSPGRKQKVSPTRSYLAVAVLVLGLAGIAQYGFDTTNGSDSFFIGSPLRNGLWIAAGYALLIVRTHKQEVEA